MNSRAPALPAVAWPRWHIHLKLVGMAALWGASWPSGRVLAQQLPPLTAASWRFGLALVLLLVWLHVKGGTRRLGALSLRQWLGLAAAGAVGFVPAENLIGKAGAILYSFASCEQEAGLRCAPRRLFERVE